MTKEVKLVLFNKLIQKTQAQGDQAFEETLRALPPAKYKRLIEIRKAYPGVSIKMLSEDIKQEVHEIFESMDTAPTPRENRIEQSEDTIEDYSTLYSIIGTDLQKDVPVRISQKDRRQGLYVVGTTGTGKTTLIANLILTDIWQGLGVALVEPHGDLTKTVIAGIPENRLKDVVLLDMTDSEYPFGLNLFQCDTPNNLTEVAKTASFVMHIFEKVWNVGTSTPQLAQVLRNATRTLIENQGTSFAEIPLLLWEETVRENLLQNLKNPQTQMFWRQYERKTQRDRDELISSTINKVDAYLNEPMIANIVSQERTTIDFRQIMDEGKILLVHLSPQLEEMSRLLGAIMIGKLLMAAFSRTEIPEARRRQFNLYCDEFQRFATADFATLITEARKFKIATTLSHQTLAQLDEANRTAAAGAANMLVFRVSGEDAEALAKSFDTTPTKEVIGEEPFRAPVSDVISHLIKRGHTDNRVTRFAQVYLKNLEDLVHKSTQYDYWPVYGEWPIDLNVYNQDIRRGRELLNESIYLCMVEKDALRYIPPLALYILSVAQHDGSEELFFPKINYYGILSPHFFQGFYKGAERFGNPSFIHQDSITTFINSCPKRKKAKAGALVNMIIVLRHAMGTLSDHPVLVDTGQYQAKYQNRTYADMEAQIVRDLTQQPNFQAKVKLLTSEHEIKTKRLPPLLADIQLSQRIAQIRAHTRQNYCKSRAEVEKDIHERQTNLRSGSTGIKTHNRQPNQSSDSDEPPPTHY